MKSRFWMAVLASVFCFAQANAKVNVNTATAEELQTLDGIGPVRAQLIIDYRNQHGPFKTIKDLRQIPELRGTVVEGLKGRITYSGPTKISGTDRASKRARDDADEAAPTGKAVPQPKPKALTPPAPAEPAARPASPGSTTSAKPAVPASPAKPAMPSRAVAQDRPASVPQPVDQKASGSAAPARPAMPAQPARPATVTAKPAAPDVRPASPGPAKPAAPAMKPAQPVAKPAAPAGNPASPVGKPAGPAMPARPAQPAVAN